MDEAERLYLRAAALVREAAGARSHEMRRRLLRQAKTLGLQAAQLTPEPAAVCGADASVRSSR